MEFGESLLSHSGLHLEKIMIWYQKQVQAAVVV